MFLNTHSPNLSLRHGYKVQLSSTILYEKENLNIKLPWGKFSNAACYYGKKLFVAPLHV